ncbi:hypothetical protein V6N13_008218 [Hibiscus sabdariffa]
MLNQRWGGDKPVTLVGSYVDNPDNPIRCKEFMVEDQKLWDARKVLQRTSNPPGMVGRRARKSMSGAVDDSTTKFPISGKVPLEWLTNRLASPRPGHASRWGCS